MHPENTSRSKRLEPRHPRSKSLDRRQSAIGYGMGGAERSNNANELHVFTHTSISNTDQRTGVTQCTSRVLEQAKQLYTRELHHVLAELIVSLGI